METNKFPYLSEYHIGSLIGCAIIGIMYDLFKIEPHWHTFIIWGLMYIMANYLLHTLIGQRNNRQEIVRQIEDKYCCMCNSSIPHNGNEITFWIDKKTGLPICEACKK